MEKQSVRISVDMLYYARVLVDSSAALTYDTPVALKGVTEVTVTNNSAKVPHWSDGGPSEIISQDGDITVAFSHDGLTAAVKKDILGTDYSSSTGLYREGVGETSNYIALGYRSKKGNGEYRYTWFLKGQVSKSGETNQTFNGTVTPQQDSYTFFAVKPIYYAAQTYGIKNSVDSDDAAIPSGLTAALLAVPETGWFSNPLYTPVAPGTVISDLAGATGSGAAGTMALTFSAPTGATSVYAQVKDPIANEWIRATTSAAITAASTSATITGLTPGNTYDVRLVVIGGTKNGFSNVDEDVVAHA
jgi:phi13 family phage major tail protein